MLGRRIFSAPSIGLAGALLLATSPIVVVPAIPAPGVARADADARRSRRGDRAASRGCAPRQSGRRRRDRAVAFLQANGRHPYFVLDGDERRLFSSRFAAANVLGRLDWRPFAVLADADVSIFDAAARDAVIEPVAIAASRRTGWRCDPPYVWPPPLRIP